MPLEPNHPNVDQLRPHVIVLAAVLLLSGVSEARAQDHVTWARSTTGSVGPFDGTATKSLAVDPWGNVAMVGYGLGPANLPGPDAITIPAAGGGGDLLIARYRSNGQPSWGYLFGGPELDSAEGVAFDADGNVYMNGWFRSTFDIDPGPGVTTVAPEPMGQPDAWNYLIAKFDSAGHFLHKTQLATGTETLEGLAMGFDAANNLYVGGIYHGGIDLMDGPGDVLLPSNGNHYVAFVAKYDPLGTLLDYMALPASGSTSVLTDIVVEPDGSFVLAGLFGTAIDLDPSANTHYLTAGSSSCFYAKYSSSFDVEWGRTFGGTQGWDARVCTGLNGGYIVSGQFRGQLTIPMEDGSTGSYFLSWSDMDNFLARLSVSGEVVWFRPIPTGNALQPFSSLAAQDDGTFYAGLHYEEVNLDPGVSDFTLETSGFPIYRSGIARYDMSDGSFILGHGYPTVPSVVGLEVEPFSSGIFVSCELPATTNIDIETGSPVFASAGRVLIKYCAKPWAVESSVEGDTLFHCQTSDTLIVFTGAEEFYWYDQAVGGSPIGAGDSLYHAWSTDTITYFVEGVNWNCMGDRIPIVVLPCSNVGILDTPSQIALNVGPVPANDQIAVELENESAMINKAQLFDLTGRAMRPSEWVGARKVTVNVQGLDQGRYVLKLSLDNGQVYPVRLQVAR